MLSDKEDPPRLPRATPDIRRRELLDAGVRCLARLGPKGATGREICREAGVSHGLLRHYFGSAEALLLEAYQDLGERFLCRFEAELAADGAAPDQPPDRSPWHAFDRFVSLTFADEWAGPDALGVWIAFWGLVRARPDFAAASEAFNGRLRALLLRFGQALLQPALPVADAVAIQAAVIDGPWLDYSLAPEPTARARAAGLCMGAARRLFGP